MPDYIPQFECEKTQQGVDPITDSGDWNHVFEKTLLDFLQDSTDVVSIACVCIKDDYSAKLCKSVADSLNGCPVSPPVCPSSLWTSSSADESRTSAATTFKNYYDNSSLNYIVAGNLIACCLKAPNSTAKHVAKTAFIQGIAPFLFNSSSDLLYPNISPAGSYFLGNRDDTDLEKQEFLNMSTTLSALLSQIKRSGCCFRLVIQYPYESYSDLCKEMISSSDKATHLAINRIVIIDKTLPALIKDVETKRAESPKNLLDDFEYHLNEITNIVAIILELSKTSYNEMYIGYLGMLIDNAQRILENIKDTIQNVPEYSNFITKNQESLTMFKQIKDNLNRYSKTNVNHP